MSAARFASYLEGGTPPGGRHAHPGARDRTAPPRSVPVDLPGTTWFAGQARWWGGGGVAFYDHGTPGPTAARAYLVTAGQLADVVAQEMGRVPRADDPVEALVLAPLPGGRHELGDGIYETLVDVGRLDGLAMLTFTAPYGVGHVARTAPSPDYLATIATGLRESRGWDDAQVERYLATLTA